jgi:biopolymer transport protein ExbB/TolQ
MNLSILETTMSWAAILIFIVLINWLILFIVGTQFHRRHLKLLRSSIDSLSNLSTGIEPMGDSSFQLPIITTINPGFHDPSRLLYSAAKAWKERDRELFHAICDQFHCSISLSPSWLLLPKLATKFGLLFTVIGSSLVYMRIESMNSPIDLMTNMQTALLTTVAGLVIEIICLVSCTNVVDESIRVTQEHFEEAAMAAR